MILVGLAGAAAVPARFDPYMQSCHRRALQFPPSHHSGYFEAFAQNFTKSASKPAVWLDLSGSASLFGVSGGGAPPTPPTPPNPSKAMVVENVPFRVVPRPNPRRTNQCTLKPEEPFCGVLQVRDLRGVGTCKTIVSSYFVRWQLFVLNNLSTTFRVLCGVVLLVFSQLG